MGAYKPYQFLQLYISELFFVKSNVTTPSISLQLSQMSLKKITPGYASKANKLPYKIQNTYDHFHTSYAVRELTTTHVE